MSILSAIEALSPVQYYRLNELTGVVAHDSGSAGFNGSYDVGVDLGLPGPETGTYSALFQRQLKMAALLSALGTGDQTMLWWQASYSRAQFGNVVVAGDLTTGAPTNGWGVCTDNTVANGYSGTGYQLIRNAARGGLGGSTPDDQWHMIAATITSGGVGKLYIDGVLISTLTTQTRNAPTSSSRLYCGANLASTSWQLAHFAWWTSVLTDSQIAAVYAARDGPQQIAYLAGQFASANNNIYGTAGDPTATLTAIYASTAGISDQVTDVATNVGLLTLAVDSVRTMSTSILTWVSGWPDAATSIANWLAPKVNDVLSRLNAGFPSPVSGLTPGTPHTLTGTGNLVSTGRGVRVESFTVPPGWGHYDAAIQQWVPRIAAITLMAPDASANLVPLLDFDVTYDPTVVMYQGTLPSRIYYWVAPGCTIVLTELV